jgi:site-specific DNA-methyltransferase (adenine-specific)
MKNRGNEFGFGDTGTAARFFFSSKAGGDDRANSLHPTVKPLALMEWLVRLVCPPGGTVLDPFAGTGVTGEACLRQGFRAVLIEREADYHRDILYRMGRLSGADAPLFSWEAA